MELEAFNRSIIVHRANLLAQARMIVKNNDTAEDLVQEVLLRLWAMRDKLDAHPNPPALAKTMLHNMAIDHLRHQQLEQGRQTAEATSRSTEIVVEQRNEVDIIRQIVNHLPPLQAQIFRMKEIEGYESEEIMKITGCSSDSLRQNLSRARRKIREEFIRITKTQRQ